jgi:hypothetical protein
LQIAGVTPAFCAKPRGHSVGMLPRRDAKWIDGRQYALERSRLEMGNRNRLIPDVSQETALIGLARRAQRIFLGWLMGLEPTTTRITIWDSTN